MIKMVVFDMAGTVVDEDNVVYKTLQRALNNGGIAVTLQQVLADCAGKEKSIAISDITYKYEPLTKNAVVRDMYEDFLDMLDEAYEHLDVIPVRGAEEIFRELKRLGIYRALNTGYNARTANQLICKLGWELDEDFDALVTASDVMKTQPHPDMIIQAMEQLTILDSKQVLKIGDSSIDIQEGKNAQCGITVGITTGAHTRAQLEAAEPDYVIDHLSDLLAIVRR